MNYKKHILFFLLLIFCFTDCKKYPDGPLVSFRTKRARIAGLWEVESFLVNGADSIALLSCKQYYFRGKDWQTISAFSCPGTIFDGGFGFEDNKKVLFISGSSFDKGTTPFVTNTSLRWDIQRLTNKQMWLKANLNNKEYYNKFKKIRDE